MLVINGKEVHDYSDYATLNGEDILNFMATQSAKDISELKEFVSTPKETVYENRTVTRKPNFFEIRNWVLEKYDPDILINKRNTTTTLIDRILEL